MNAILPQSIIFILVSQMSIHSPPLPLATASTSPSSFSTTSPSPEPHPLSSIGIRIQPFASISSGKQLEKEKSIRIQLFWKLLDPNAVQSIRHDCGKRLFIRMIKSIKNNNLPTATENNNDLLKSANCSFTQDYAVISLYHDSSSEFVMTEGNMVALSIAPFTGSDPEEVCIIRLRGYEKFARIFVAYSFVGGSGPKASSLNILKFPQSFAKLVNVVAVKKEGRSSPSAVIFDPNIGKGKTFQKTKKCIEVLLSGKHTPFVMEVVEYFCIVECNDIEAGNNGSKSKSKATKKTKEDNKKRSNNGTSAIKTAKRVEL